MAMWTKAQCKVQWELFCLFIRIGLMTFGGGTSMLPILQRELADQRGWLTEEELMDYYAIGQCTPGIIALNVATFTGRKRGGDLGGVVATAGFILPSLCIIIALAGVITSVEHLKWVQNAFAGIRACICVQILNAVIRLAKKHWWISGPWGFLCWCLCWESSRMFRRCGSYWPLPRRDW